MELIQKQVQALNQQLLQSLELLQMSTMELEEYLRDLAQENPMVELNEDFSEMEQSRDNRLLDRLNWLEDNDQQNYYYQRVEEEEFDPLARVGHEGGLEETLFRFISRQLYPLKLDEDTAQRVRYLAACLDQDGYLRIPLCELADNLSISVKELEPCLELLRSLEPAGIGAVDLSQCLELQLQRIHERGPALEIVRGHLEALAKRHYRSIATKLSISVKQVQQAERVIHELEPRPGAPFERPSQVPYILPDLFVEEMDGHLVVRLRNENHSMFHINRNYQALIRQSEDPEVKGYLIEKLHQAEGVLRSLEQRKSTLLRCAQAIVDGQLAFFCSGPQALRPMKMAEVAQKLDLHESTISRAVRDKYLQCSRGVFPMRYFFSRNATIHDTTQKEVGVAAAYALLRRLVDQEDKAHPMSDQSLCESMAALGCPISRRTVSKYRKELNIPNTSGRRLL